MDEARIRGNRVMFWVVFSLSIAASLFLFHFEGLSGLIFLVAAVITMIIAFVVKIRRYVKEGKYYNFSNGSWMWSAVSEGYFVGWLIRFVYILILVSSGKL